MNSKMRGYALVAALIVAALVGLFLSTVLAKQRRAAVDKFISARTATNISSGTFAFSAPIELIKSPISLIFFQTDAEPEITALP